MNTRSFSVSLTAPRARRASCWRRLVGAALLSSPSLLATAVALVSAAYLVGSGHSDAIVLAWVSSQG